MSSSFPIIASRVLCMKQKRSPRPLGVRRFMPSSTERNDLPWRTRPKLLLGIPHNASWMLSAQSMQMLGRFIYFAVAAHVLGPSGYGTFVACTALIGTMAPFASLGTADVLIKYVSRDRESYAHQFGNALLVTTAVSTLLMGLAFALRRIM